MAFAHTCDLQHQDLEKLRLELHELCYQLDDAVETKLDTQHLEEQIAQLHASIESIDSRDGAMLSVKNALVRRRRCRGHPRYRERLLAPA